MPRTAEKILQDIGVDIQPRKRSAEEILQDVSGFFAEEPEPKRRAFFPKTVPPLSLTLGEKFIPEKVSLEEPSGDQAKKILLNAVKELGGFATWPVGALEQIFHPAMKPPEEEIPEFLRGTAVERPYAVGKGFAQFGADVARGWRDVLTGVALYPQAQLGKLSPEDEKRYREALERLAERPLTPLIGAVGARAGVSGAAKLRAKLRAVPKKRFAKLAEAIERAPEEARMLEELPMKVVAKPPTAEQADLLGKFDKETVDRSLRTRAKTPEEVRRLQGIEEQKPKPLPGEEALRVQREMKERLKGETGAVLDPMREISRKTSEMIEKAKAPPEIRAGVAEAKKAMIEHDVQIRSAEFTRMQLEDIIKRNIPKEERQMLVIHALEHEMKGPYWDRLNPFERKLTEWLEGEKTKLDQFVKDRDVLEMMAKQKGIRHLFHYWINPKTGQPYEAMYGKFSKGLPQAKQRVIPDYATGMQATPENPMGTGKGMKPASTNPGRIIGLEWESVMRADQTRGMVKTIHDIGADPKVAIQLMKGKKPKPIRMIERWDLLQKQGLTEGYKRRDYPCLDKAIVFRDANGMLVKLKGTIGVRKEVDSFLDAYIRNPNYGTLDALNFVSKNLKLGLSMFHPIQLGWQEVCNWRVPFVHIPKGLRQIKELSPELRVLYEQGLDIRKGYEDYGYRNKFFKGATLVGKSGNVITWPVKQMRSLIFDVIQPGMKISFAMHRYEKLLPKYLKKGLTKEFCARDVVKAADSHFSHEHYKRSLLETDRWVVKAFFSPGSRRFWQRVLLSFTWQRSHLRVAGAVGKSFMTDKMIRRLHLQELGPIKADYRRYAIGAAALISTADAYNYIATKEMDGEGKHIWENPKGKGFAVRALWNEPSYTVTTKDGKTKTIPGGAAYFRPLKSVFEVAEWVSDPFKKATYKLSPAASGLAEQISPSKYQKEYEGWGDVPRRMLDFTREVGTPIMAAQVSRALKGERTPQTGALPFFGFPTSKDPENKRRRRVLAKLEKAVLKGDWDEVLWMIQREDWITQKTIDKIRRDQEAGIRDKYFETIEGISKLSPEQKKEIKKQLGR